MLGFLLCWSGAQAARVPISVFPNPIQFGTVAQNSTSLPITIFVSNLNASPVDVTGITISGANSSDFTFSGATCVGSIAGGQTCEMNMTFTPTLMGSLSASLLVAFTGTGSPISIPITGTGGNPIPSITSISPPSVYQGSPGLTLTFNGANFLPTSIAYTNGTALVTKYKSSTQITAQIPASDLNGTQYLYLYVSNPAPGGGNSNSMNLEVIALDPSVGSLSPSAVPAKSAPLPIMVNGGNFMTGATVLWNGKPLSTTYISSSELQVQLDAPQLAQPQIVPVSVSNPPPGGISPDVSFNVTIPAVVRTLNVPANDLVWDPHAQRLYASVPSSYGPNGNSIAVINPANGKVEAYHFAGSEPTALALSQDGTYLYVGLNGNGSVQRMVLPAFTLDIDVSLGINEFGGLNEALDIQASPGDSHTFAVALGSSSCCGGGPLEFFTDSTQLANSVSFPQISYVQFVNASTLYGYDSGTLSQVSVNSTGGTLTTQWNDLLTGSGGIEYDAGLIYGNGGQVFNPSTGELVGTYDVSGQFNSNSNYLLPESAINSTFLVGTSPFFSSLGITVYDLSRFTPIAVINLSQVSGTPSSPLLSWGSNGLAFVVTTGCCNSQVNQVVLVHTGTLPVAGQNNTASSEKGVATAPAH
jgi:trimeric autotransporter adhesin